MGMRMKGQGDSLLEELNNEEDESAFQSPLIHLSVEEFLFVTSASLLGSSELLVWSRARD